MHVMHDLLPRPKRVTRLPGSLLLRSGAVILVAADEEPDVRGVADLLRRNLADRFGVRVTVADRFNPGLGSAAIRLALAGDDRLGRVAWRPPRESADPAQAYRLMVTSRGAQAVGGGVAGLRHAVQTLLQLTTPSGKAARISGVSITDWPSLAHRAVMEDVSRHKVPTLAELKAFADRLAGWKINALQLYLENVFTFRSHPGIGRGYARITPAEIRELDAYCRARGIELVPNLASFGHMEKTLERPELRKYSIGVKPFSLVTPGRPETYRFLNDLFKEYLPCFSSRWFNVNCDETFDLGKGRSAPAVKRLGKGEVYLRHMLELHRMVTGTYGKRMMMWGDIIKEHPGLIPRLPKDIIVLPWGYMHRWTPQQLRPFKKAGLDFIVCPGTVACHTLSPWVHVSNLNIQSAGQSAKATGAKGIMTTDWGDGGHQQPIALSLHGLAQGADAAWNAGTTPSAEIARRFGVLEFGAGGPAANRLWAALGHAQDALGLKPVYKFWWYSVNFGLMFYDHTGGGLLPIGDLYKDVKRSGVNRLARVAAQAAKAWAELDRRKAGDALIRRELRYSVRQLEHLAAYLAWRLDIDAGLRGPAMRARGTKLVRSLRWLRGEFLFLWNARNRPHKRETTLKLYAAAERFTRQLLRIVA
jgi:hypothetical protein